MANKVLFSWWVEFPSVYIRETFYSSPYNSEWKWCTEPACGKERHRSPNFIEANVVFRGETQNIHLGFVMKSSSIIFSVEERVS